MGLTVARAVFENVDEEQHQQLAWLVATVRPQHETAVVPWLEERGIEPFSPTYSVSREWSDRNKTILQPVFPGYVFCRMARRDRTAVLRTPGVRSVVGFGGVPAAVPDEEIERIRAVVGSGYPVKACPYLDRGQQVRIERGPLKGIEGLILDVKGDYRLVVSVTLLQRSVSVSIDRDAVVPLVQAFRRSA